MDTLTIFVTQFVLSVVVFSLLAKWFVGPWLADKPIRVALIALTFPHAMRHVGLSFLVPGLVADSLPGGTFADLAAYGDFATGLVALVALFALKGRWRIALPLVWLFNIAGTVDLANALRQTENVPHLLTMWYIPTFFVPLLLVTHFMMFARLFQHAFGRSSSQIETRVESIPSSAGQFRAPETLRQCRGNPDTNTHPPASSIRLEALALKSRAQLDSDFEGGKLTGKSASRFCKVQKKRQVQLNLSRC